VLKESIWYKSHCFRHRFLLVRFCCKSLSLKKNTDSKLVCLPKRRKISVYGCLVEWFKNWCMISQSLSFLEEKNASHRLELWIKSEGQKWKTNPMRHRNTFILIANENSTRIQPKHSFLHWQQYSSELHLSLNFLTSKEYAVELQTIHVIFTF
jgi:hypothetical protein